MWASAAADEDAASAEQPTARSGLMGAAGPPLPLNARQIPAMSMTGCFVSAEPACRKSHDRNYNG